MVREEGEAIGNSLLQRWSETGAVDYEEKRKEVMIPVKQLASLAVVAC